MDNSFDLLPQHQMFPDFYPCHCGCTTCKPLQQFGPAARPHYVLYVILTGKGTLLTGEASVALRAGDGFLIRPDEQAAYQSDTDTPWSHVWLGFRGARCEEYLTAIGLGEGQQIFRAPDGESLRELVVQMQRYNTPGTENDFMLQGLLYQFFACLARTLTLPLSAVSRSDREHFYVRRAVEFVQYNYANHITVSDMARYVSLNRSYLFTLFQRVLQISPQEFLTRFRLTRAKEQLAHTAAPVSAIAQSVGYRDPLVFSKAFKTMAGMTPMQYRRENSTRSAEGAQPAARGEDTPPEHRA